MSIIPDLPIKNFSDVKEAASLVDPKGFLPKNWQGTALDLLWPDTPQYKGKPPLACWSFRERLAVVLQPGWMDDRVPTLWGCSLMRYQGLPVFKDCFDQEESPIALFKKCVDYAWTSAAQPYDVSDPRWVWPHKVDDHNEELLFKLRQLLTDQMGARQVLIGVESLVDSRPMNYQFRHTVYDTAIALQQAAGYKAIEGHHTPLGIIRAVRDCEYNQEYLFRSMLSTIREGRDPAKDAWAWDEHVGGVERQVETGDQHVGR
jgi:hypothetical protein